MRVRIAHRLIASLIFGLACEIGLARPSQGSLPVARLPPTFTQAAFDPPPDQNAPQSTAGGGSRPAELTCVGQGRDRLQAVALAPKPFVGISSQAQPTVWVYLSTPGVSRLEVSLFNEQLEGLWQQSIAVDDSAGPVPIVLSDALSELDGLTPGQTYYWSAAIPCNPNRRTEDWVVGGWIRYEPLALEDARAVEHLTDLEQVSRYLETGYWYDAIAHLLLLSNNTLPLSSTEQDTSSAISAESATESLTEGQPAQAETDFEEIWGSLLKQANLIDELM